MDIPESLLAFSFGATALTVILLALWWSRHLFARTTRHEQAEHVAPDSRVPPAVLFGARPTFEEGAARILDFGNALRNPVPPLSSAEQDWVAFAADWQILVTDLRDVVVAASLDPTIAYVDTPSAYQESHRGWLNVGERQHTPEQAAHPTEATR